MPPTVTVSICSMSYFDARVFGYRDEECSQGDRTDVGLRCQGGAGDVLKGV